LRRTRPLVLAAVVVAGTGCASERGAPDGGARSGELVVFAASSLTNAFTELGAAFERTSGGTPVRNVFAGSQTLRLQLEQGAKADVFASADAEHLAALTHAGIVDTGRVFACNELVVVVPRAGGAAVAAFSELDRADRIVVGAANVPVGAYTRRVMERAAEVYGPAFADGVRARIASEESNVRLVRAKVELGEADAALVYRTDALASSSVRALELPPEVAVQVAYPIARVLDSSRAATANAFVDFVTSQVGAAILRRYGFVPGCVEP
jgi:molybdate transport system substrate-binding protein